MNEFKAKIINVEYHKPEYHIIIEIYINNVHDSDAIVNAQDNLSFIEVRDLILNKLHKIKNALDLGAELNSHIGQEIILT